MQKRGGDQVEGSAIRPAAMEQIRKIFQNGFLLLPISTYYYLLLHEKIGKNR